MNSYRDGRIDVIVDREAAAKLVAARMLLPLVLLPFFGLAVALALAGYWIAGAAVFLGALGVRWAVRRSAPGFVLSRCLQDPQFFAQVFGERILTISSAK
ncbi:MAG TPA: hypothetical protein VD965_08815 [Burkholderiales bacterium]|nr:hypothetical protein [Burkholderiales bacterium]